MTTTIPADVLDQVRARAVDPLQTPVRARRDLALLLGELDRLGRADRHVFHATYSDRIPLGHYLTLDQARAHCEDLVRDCHHTGTELHLEWLDPTTWKPLDADTDTDGAQLLRATVNGQTQLTPYTVTPVLVHAVYDPEAEG